MKLFTNFFSYLLAGFVLYFLGLLFKKKFPAAFKVFFIAAPAATLVIYMIALIGALPPWFKSISAVIRWVDFASLVLLGYGLAYWVGSRDRQDIIFLIRGLSIQLGIAFIGGAVEQYKDITDIAKFFLTCGYTIWFMHVILCIELVGGLLLLFGLRFTVGVLLAVMAGAVITHFKRGDPFNYAIAAIELTVKCAILLWLCLQNRPASSIPRSERSG